MTPDPAGRLLELAVTDLALIDRLRLEFGVGFNVITGETGAGKSLLIDALGLALGARADTGLVRHGAASARVEALFDRRPEALIVVREVAAEGRSTARLDDEPVTAARLADSVGRLVEVHGQHDQQRLLDDAAQRDLLDAYGGTWVAREVVGQAVERWRANRAAMAELAVDPRELARRIDLAEHEAGEIAAAKLRPGEADDIRARLGAGRHAEAIVRGGAAIHEALVGEGTAARDRIGAATHEARELSRFDPRFAPLADRLAGLDGEVEDVAAEVRVLVEGLDHDPADVARLEERLSTIYDLERRYGDDEAAVVAHGDAMAAEAGRLRGLDGERERRQAEDAALLAVVADAAATLSSLRADASGRLAAAVSVALDDLGFARSDFEVGAWAGDRPARANQPSRSTGMRWPSTRPGSTRSSSGSPRTSGSRPVRSRGSPPAASSAGSPSRSRRCWRQPMRHRRSSSTRSTAASAGAARTRSAEACGPWPAATRSCA